MPRRVELNAEARDLLLSRFREGLHPVTIRKSLAERAGRAGVWITGHGREKRKRFFTNTSTICRLRQSRSISGAQANPS
jgi:hypothetical protein